MIKAMKKQLLILLLVVSAALMCRGQGTFVFANFSGSAVQYQTNSGPDYWVNPEFAPVPVGAGYVQALWAPLGTTEIHLFQPIGAAVAIGPVAGYFSGGVRTIPAGTGFDGIAPGAEVALVVRGWVGSATTWEQAYFGMGAFMVGWSAIFNLATGDPTSTPAEIPTPMRPMFPGLNFTYIPEPSALALVGGSALWLGSRRRNYKAAAQ